MLRPKFITLNCQARRNTIGQRNLDAPLDRKYSKHLLSHLMRRPALIFDFGNVIAFFDFVKATTKLGARLGITGRELYDRLGPLGFATELAAFERGQISAVDFSTRILRMISLTSSHQEFADAWADIFTPNESIIPIVENLKAQGYSLILGSNTNELHAQQFRNQFATILKHFDHLVLSYEVGHIKPSREFFVRCVEAANMAPPDCVFIDDLPENIEGARTAGLRGIVYLTSKDLVSDLKKLGVEVSM